MKNENQLENIGPYQIRALPTGLFGLDGGAMFGTVPKVLWNRHQPSDEQNRIALEARALLISGNHMNILIDCGVGGDFEAKYGDKWGPKFKSIYGVSTSNGIINSLEKYSLKPSDITHVFLTHLHFDHAGGATQIRGRELVPTFENAKYFIQADNLKTAKSPNLREEASYFKSNFEPLERFNVLHVLNGAQDQVLPGISVLLSNGHTHGMQLVKISDTQKTLVYCADLIPTSTHLRKAWIMGYDLLPLEIIKEKERLLKETATHSWILFFEHDPHVAAATVKFDKEDFKLGDIVPISENNLI